MKQSCQPPPPSNRTLRGCSADSLGSLIRRFAGGIGVFATAICLTEASGLGQSLTLVSATSGVPVFHPMEFKFDAPYGTNQTAPYNQEWTGAWNSSTPNPWLHARITGRFTHSSTSTVLDVPGFYDTDGGDVNSTAIAGDIWTIRFAPPLAGTWTLVAYVELGDGINAADKGTLSCSNSNTWCANVSSITIYSLNTSAAGFLSKGILQADDTAHYLRFVRQTSTGTEGPYFLKTGVGSPENLLGYAGFTGLQNDGTWDGGGADPSPGFVHDYFVRYNQPLGAFTDRDHKLDWVTGMPDWSRGSNTQQGKAIIGALHFLSLQGLNGIYCLPMNLGGDGHETHPFAALDPTCPNTSHTSPCYERQDINEVLCYHAKRMREWNTVFEFCMEEGIMVELVVAEQELTNINWLNDDPVGMNPPERVGVARKLFLKQMIAEFGQNVALVFNLCEEDHALFTPTDHQFTRQELEAMHTWMAQWDVYGHPVTVHDTYVIYDPLVGTSPTTGQWLRLTSMQASSEPQGVGGVDEISVATESARNGGSTWGYLASGVMTIATVDEHGWYETGIAPIEADMPENWNHTFSFDTDNTQDSIRRRILYDVLFSGGNFSCYFGWDYIETDGGNDLTCDDFRSRESLYSDMRIASEFLLNYTNFWQCYPDDTALGGSPTVDSYFGKPEVLRHNSPEQWFIYYPTVHDGSGNVVSSLGAFSYGSAGTHSSWGYKWFDPVTGTELTSTSQEPFISGTSGSFDPKQFVPDEFAHRDVVLYFYGL